MAQGSSIVQDVRERALRISELFGHDPRKYLEHLRELQDLEKDLVVQQVTVIRSVDPKVHGSLKP